MASYHCSIKPPLSRAKGKSLMAKAAYNARTEYRDERTGQKTKDYSYKGGLVDSFVTFDAKRNAPEWAKDPERILNAAVAAEKRKDAREGQEIVLGFIHELGPQKNRWMLNDFLREQFTRGTGRVAFVNIHEPDPHGDERNMHAHVLLMLREIGPDGFGKRLSALEPEDYQHIRQKWAEYGAKELRKAGFTQEADRYAEGWRELEQQRQAALERGDLAFAETLNREATTHRGPAADAMERKGQQTERGNIHRDTVDRNQQAQTARENNAAMKIELAEIQKAIAQEERAWADRVAQAAIEKEKIERRFVEPQQRREPGTLAGGDREQERSPFTPPAAEQQPQWSGLKFAAPKLDRPAPDLTFKDAAREAGRDQRPREAPEHLYGTAAEIWLANHRSDSARSFAAALDEKGIALAITNKEEAEQSHKEAEAAKAEGRYASAYRENEIVAVDDRAQVYRLSERITGSDFRNMQAYLQKLDKTKLQGIVATRQMMHDRAAAWEASTGLAAALNPVQRKEIEPLSKEPRQTRGLTGMQSAAASASYATGKAAARTVGKLFDGAVNLFAGLFEMFDPGPPKTRREIENAIEEHDRHAASNEKDRHEAQRHETQVSDHERIMEATRQQQQIDQQRDKDFKRYRGDERER